MSPYYLESVQQGAEFQKTIPKTGQGTMWSSTKIKSEI